MEREGGARNSSFFYGFVLVRVKLHLRCFVLFFVFFWGGLGIFFGWGFANFEFCLPTVKLSQKFSRRKVISFFI